MDEKNSGDIEEQVNARIRAELEKLGEGDPESGPVITSQLVKECLNSNETGDGILYAVLHRDKFVYNKSSAEWYAWTGHHWKRDIRERYHAYVDNVCETYLKEAFSLTGLIAQASRESKKELMDQLQDFQQRIYKRVWSLRSDKRRNTCIKFARNNKDYPIDIEGDELDQEPWQLPCANGVIDLRTGKLNDGRPDDYLSKASPVEFVDIATPAPLWELFLLEIFEDDKDLVEYLQRLLGYAITGLNKEHVLPILWGPGRNGKGTIVEMVNHVMGELAGPIPTEMLLDQGRARSSSGPTPDIMSLRGLRIAFASESDEGRRFSPSRVKWLSGGDTLTARNPHDKYPVTFNTTHTLFMLTNDKPQAPAQDFAFWERVHLIPLRLKYVNRKPSGENEREADLDLLDKLKGEDPGILAWMVRGCIAWQKQGLNVPRSVSEATAKYRRDEDILEDFFDVRCCLDPKASMLSSDGYAQFSEWYAENMGKKVPSQRWFGLRMTKRFEKSTSSPYTYFGIGLLQ